MIYCNDIDGNEVAIRGDMTNECEHGISLLHDCKLCEEEIEGGPCDACDGICITLSGDPDRAVFCCNCRLKDAPAFYQKDRCEECEKRLCAI